MPLRLPVKRTWSGKNILKNELSIRYFYAVTTIEQLPIFPPNPPFLCKNSEPPHPPFFGKISKTKTPFLGPNLKTNDWFLYETQHWTEIG